MNRYRKLLVAVAGLVAASALELFGPEWGPVVVAVLTALGVYRVPNEDT